MNIMENDEEFSIKKEDFKKFNWRKYGMVVWVLSALIFAFASFQLGYYLGVREALQESIPVINDLTSLNNELCEQSNDLTRLDNRCLNELKGYTNIDYPILPFMTCGTLKGIEGLK